MRRKLGDRRVKPRYDLVGELVGTLETVLRLPLVNVSPGGALIESHVPLPVQSVHRLTFDCEGRDAATQVKVHHVRPVTSDDGRTRYLIGVEFMSPHPALLGEIGRWMMVGGETAPSEA